VREERRERNWGWAEVALLGVSLALRLFLVSQATWQPVADTRDYHALARSLLAGEGYRQVYDGETLAYHGLTFHAYRMPGYPAVLAAVYGLLGWRTVHAYLANVAFDLAGQVAALALARRLFGRRVALWSQGLLTLHLIWTPSLQTEPLFTALFTGLALLVLTGPRPLRPARTLGVGVLLAAATFVRPIALCVVPVALWREARREGLARAAALSCLLILPTTLALGAWGARNHARLGQVVLLSTNLGLHNSREFAIDRATLVREAVARGANEAEVNRLLLAEIGGIVRRTPALAAGIYVRRVAEIFSPRRPRTELWRSTFPGRGLARGARQLYRTLALQYWITYPLAIAGAVLSLRARPEARGLLALIGSFALVHALVSHGNLRFAAPLYPLLAILAGHALDRLTSALQRPGSRSSQPPLA
jgi:hypothetical protein